MLNTSYSTQFKRDYKLCQKRGFDMQNIITVMFALENELPLEPNRREHQLQGKYKGFLECHIAPDWLLIYKINNQSGELYFSRTGTHTDLFD